MKKRIVCRVCRKKQRIVHTDTYTKIELFSGFVEKNKGLSMQTLTQIQKKKYP